MKRRGRVRSNHLDQVKKIWDSGALGPGAYSTLVQHDDWCDFLNDIEKGLAPRPCNCRPNIIFKEIP